MAWRVHMEYFHSANSASWTESGYRGGQVGRRDGKDTTDWGYVCFGCTATFSSAADLVSHLLSVHGAA